MGTSVRVACECGVEGEVLIGGGMQTFMTTCYFPGSCRSCRTLVTINVLEADCRCPTCKTPGVIPFGSAGIEYSPGTRVVVYWHVEYHGKLELTDGSYECPKCGNVSLRFSEGDLLWD